MFSFDATVTHAINSPAGTAPALDFVMVWLSSIGVPVMVALVALQWFRRRERKHVRHIVASAGLAFLLGLALNQVVLLVVHRARPYVDGVTHLLIPPSVDWSFPSDHATVSVAVAATLLLQGARRAGYLCLVFALLMVASRVYVGIHYVGDVIGGALTGVVAAALVTRVYREGSRIDRIVTGIL